MTQLIHETKIILTVFCTKKRAMTGTYGPKYKRLMPCATRTIIGKISVEPHILIMHPVSLIMYPPYCLPRQWPIDLFTVYDAILAGGRTRLKLQ